MTPQDRAAIDWFFSVGVAAFERSTFGDAMARAKEAEAPGVAQAMRDIKRTDPWHCGISADAWPTSPQQRQEPSYTPDIKALTRYGDVSRRLMKLERADAQAHAALTAYFGHEGASWSTHKRGRFVALFPLTPSGAELLARARRAATGPQLELSDRDRLRVEVELDQVRSDVACMRHVLLTRAQREAEALYARAERAWEGTR